MPSRSHQSPLYQNLYNSLQLAYEVSASKIGHTEVPHNINGFSNNALSAFMLTSSIWESLLNWAFDSVWTRIYFGDKVAARCTSLGQDLDRLSLLKKTYVLPLIAFEKSFNKAAFPFQGLQTLVGIRNHIVHDVQSRAPEKEINVLRAAGCLLNNGELPKNPGEEQPWQYDISTLESIRWCLNLLPSLTDELIKLSGHDGAKRLATFKIITPSFAKTLINSPLQFVPFGGRK